MPRKRKRKDGPTIVRTGDGNPALCVLCDKTIQLRPDDVNTCVEVLPIIKSVDGRIEAIRRFRHALCIDMIEKRKKRRGEKNARNNRGASGEQG